MEIATEESEEIVRDICEAVEKARKKGENIQPYQQIIYDIDYLLLETNSGASYEQYFRWASVDEIKRIVPALIQAAIEDIAELTEKAIKVAFPAGIPNNEDDKDELTDWTEEQEKKLTNLFETLEESNGRITNLLAKYAKSTDGENIGNA